MLMRSFRIFAFACLSILVAGFQSLSLAQNRDTKAHKILAVQKALQEGGDHLRKGNFQAAVFILESQVSDIEGNKEYLDLLQQAYRGHLRDLHAKGLTQETIRYQKRLEILDQNIVPKDVQESKPAGLASSLINKGFQALAPTATTASPTSTPTAPKVRAKVEELPEDNLFSFTNSQRYVDAKMRLEQAEREFSQKNYKLASRLYEESYRLEPKAMPQAVERWAYSRLYAVVESMNQNQSGGADPVWEKEIRTSLQMAPKLQSFGNQLLSHLGQRTPAANGLAATNHNPTAEIKHTGPYKDGWHLAQTTNFRIWHRISQAEATQVAKAAEAFRAEAAMKWFQAVGADWNPICEIYLHASAQEYSKNTGAPTASPGHTTLRTEGSRVLSRRIDLHVDDPNMMIGVLPHETTHVVIAGRLGDQPVPRWADEGMSVLAEPRARIQKHLDNLPKHAQEKSLFPCSRLMQMADYPEPKLVGPFYAQSVGVVDYLTRLKGPTVFSEFMKEGLQSGYEPALRKFYGIKSYGELDQLWWNAAMQPTQVSRN